MFHKVLSHVGSFTDIRGGHVYPTLIRKSVRWDIRVLLQSGTNDHNLVFGDWWLSNLQMESALTFRGYDHCFVGGTGGHNGEHGGVILPESAEWLWRKEKSKAVPKWVGEIVAPRGPSLLRTYPKSDCESHQLLE